MEHKNLLRSALAMALSLIIFVQVPVEAQTSSPILVFPKGLKFDDPAELAKIKPPKKYRNFTPPKRDLSKYFPLPGRQKTNSCVGWAVAYAARSARYAWDNKASPKIRNNIASPIALYNSVYKRKSCGGTVIRSALSFMKQTGVPGIDEFPQNKKGECFYQIEKKHYPMAKRFKIKNFYRLSKKDTDNKRDINEIKEQIAQFKPVVFGMPVPKSFHAFRGSGVFRDSKPPFGGGHAMVLVGYDDTKPGGGAFKLINSWGKGWGQKGYGWISYDAAKALVREAFVMETRPEKKSRPGPAPKPIVIEDQDHFKGLALARKIASKIDCSGVRKFDSKNKTFQLFARTEAELKQLRASFSKLMPEFKLKTNIVPWPKCEALLTFDNQLNKPEGLSLALNGVKQNKNILINSFPVLKEGDPLVMKIRTPDFPSYLYATYLQKDAEGKHEAVHLIQSVDPLKQHPAGTEIVIGDGRDGGDEFEVSGPKFGREMIILLASASPLYSKERPWEEKERDYLSGIRDALIKKIQGKGNRRIAAQVLTVITKQKGK